MKSRLDVKTSILIRECTCYFCEDKGHWAHHCLNKDQGSKTYVPKNKEKKDFPVPTIN